MHNTHLNQDLIDQLPTLSEVIIEVLAFFNTHSIYGVGGDFAANLISTLSKDLDIYSSSNEMHGGFSACAQAEIDGLGVCLSTYMVGSLPCTTAAAMAVTERLPVVFISGAPGEGEVNDLAIHHTIHPSSSWKTQYDNALQSFAALGMTVERLQGQRVAGQPNIAGERFFQLVAQAYRTKQPVFIEIPRDLVMAKTQPLRLPATIDGIYHDTHVLAGSEMVVQMIVDKLNQASHPVLYLGDGLKHNHKLQELVLSFAKRFNIPYATNWFAKGLFDEFDPLCLGAYNGILSQTDGAKYIDEKMDHVIDIATSIYAQDCNIAFATGTHTIESCDNKTVLKGAAVGERDLIEIFELLLQSDIPTFEFKLNQQPTAPLNDNDPMDFHTLAPTLNRLQQQQSSPFVYLPEVGNSYFASYSLKVRASNIGRSWLTNPWYGAMGTSLPYARVIAQKIKSQQVADKAIVITGDGGFNFQLNELINVLKDQTQVIIIYMRNNIYHLGKGSDADIYKCNDESFDVHKLVQAYQGEAQLCATVGQFSDCFNRYTQQDTGISLIEVPCIPIEERQCHELKELNAYIKRQNSK